MIFKLDSEYWREAAPDNVMVVPWVPQQAVLAHNNTRLFITHCGMHGVLESIYYGVPMVGMPVFIDQVMIRPGQPFNFSLSRLVACLKL